MTKMKIFSIFLFILLIPSILAIDIYPTTQTVILTTDISQNSFINITNNLNEMNYFVSLSSLNNDIIFIDNSFNLSINETKEVKMNIDTSTAYKNSSIINVIFYTKRDVLNTPAPKYVNITQTQYLPQETTIFSGSTITWTNTDNIKHSVTSSKFDEELDPGESWSYTTSGTEILTFYDKFSSFTGKIIVISLLSEEYVHNPIYDETFTLSIESYLIETNLSLTNVEENTMEVNANDNFQSVLIIENIGNKTAENVRFTANPAWIEFEYDKFYLESGKRKYIPYTISPILLSPNETGKNYTINITAQGLNTYPVYSIAKVYIPYNAELSLNQTTNAFFNRSFDEEFMISFHNMYCQAFPESRYCKVETVEKIIYRPAPLPYNYTQEDIDLYHRRQAKIDLDIERFGKDVKADMNIVKSDTEQTRLATEEVKLLATQLKQQLEQNDKDENTRMIVLIIITSMVLIGIVCFILFKFVLKKYKVDDSMRT